MPEHFGDFEWFDSSQALLSKRGPWQHSLKFWLPRQTMSVARLTARLFVSIGTSPAPKKWSQPKKCRSLQRSYDNDRSMQLVIRSVIQWGSISKGTLGVRQRQVWWGYLIENFFANSAISGNCDLLSLASLCLSRWHLLSSYGHLTKLMTDPNFSNKYFLKAIMNDSYFTSSVLSNFIDYLKRFCILYNCWNIYVHCIWNTL